MSDAFTDAAKTVKKSASGMGTVSSSMNALGIDSDILVDSAALVSAIGGIGMAASGFKSILDMYSAYKAAEATANIAKWGIAAGIVGAIAAGAGYAMSEVINNATSKVSDGDYESSEGLRQLGREVSG